MSNSRWSLALSRKLRICINSEKEDNVVRYTQIFEMFSWKFPFHLTFILEFPKFSVEWFTFRKFNNFRISWNFSQEIFLPFVPVSKISEFFGQLVSAQCLFSSKTVGKNAKQFSVLACTWAWRASSDAASHYYWPAASPFARHAHSHACTLTYFAFFPAVFEEKRGCLQSNYECQTWNI